MSVCYMVLILGLYITWHNNINMFVCGWFWFCQGRFEILSLKGSVFVDTNKSEQEIVGEIKGSFVSLSNGHAFGGKIDGVLIAATPVQGHTFYNI